ncbi:REST corepressor 3 [Eurytemora carolleeae]|uniref:REST corepressor 3 n=1 Tax=Eurytemora carolleeae TaxID=1294199 RepID=UPI000C775A49|nr:REST corepressor 3 [Eurytemora carolleeae]|eukprot:XP_023347554.1 REST corepressor 3-like [Eurytemora affinis]
MLPDKSIAALVKYYYSWKKTRTRTSLMDRHAKKLQSVRDEGKFGDENFPDPSDEEDTEKETVGEKMENCINCGISCHSPQPSSRGNLCGTCHLFWNRTGQFRPTTGPLRKDGLKPNRSIFRNATRPPKGMHINHDDLVSLATGPSGQGDSLLKSLDREILQYKRTVQSNKQTLSGLRKKTKGRDIDPYRIPEPSASRINARWTNDEHLLAVQGIRKFGKNFKVIAEILGTKTEAHTRNFFVSFKRRYNLDSVLKEYEAEAGIQGEPETEGEKEDGSDSGVVPSPPSPPKLTAAKVNGK